MLGSQPTVDLRGEYSNLDHGCKHSVLHSLEQVVIQRFWDLPSGERYEVNEGLQVFRPCDDLWRHKNVKNTNSLLRAINLDSR